MATIKSYTSLEQSKKLAEILPLESADMVYVNYIDLKGDEHYVIDFRNNQPFYEYDINAWSLAALLGVLDFPSLTQNKEDEWEVCVFDHDNDNYIEKTADNPVDACVAMIEKLHELNLL